MTLIPFIMVRYLFHWRMSLSKSVMIMNGKKFIAILFSFFLIAFLQAWLAGPFEVAQGPYRLREPQGKSNGNPRKILRKSQKLLENPRMFLEHPRIFLDLPRIFYENPRMFEEIPTIFLENRRIF